MNSYVHIALGDSAAGCLKYCLKENKDNIYFGKVMKFTDDLSTGSIYKLDENIKQRDLWLEQLYGKTGVKYYIAPNKKLDAEFIYNEIKNIYNGTLKIPKDFKVVIWHGNNVMEQISLRYIMNTFKEYELYEADVSKYITHVYDNQEYKVRCVAECRPQELELVLEKISPIDDDKKSELISQWNNLQESKATLRILQNGKIVSVGEDYYDNEILRFLSKKFKNAPRVIGNVLGTSHQIVSDTFIDYRLRNLIELDKVEYKGKLKTMRDFEVKIKDK
ncbi:DUF1835 domain-containing protein [Clostridium oceanicum]|uniref:DUF1835 domain-containing protein n=1 Tax=Clostridium oceanicum TaxID=1543 RepID=A0ABP3UK08_9CLOT